MTVDGSDVTGGPSSGGVPIAVAVFTTEPFATSAAVTVRDPVQFTTSSGSNVVFPHTAGASIRSSAISISEMATFPEFVKVKTYSMTSPTVEKELVSEVFSNSKAGAGVGGKSTSLSEGVEVISGPAGGVPVAVAVLVSAPASTSAWLIT
ncbi:hypothetical protein D3C74_239250 [compost metagenome]